MYRYISLVWNEADQQSTETVKFLKSYFEGTETSWLLAYKGDGLLVLHTGEEKNRMQAYPLNTQEGNSGGIVMGKLFKRERSADAIAMNADLNTPEARKVIQTAGRHLVDDYWGSYVAFFQDGGRKYVQVDPIGIFSCYSTSYRNVEIYFSYMPDIASCKFLKFSVDWATIAKKMLYVTDDTKAPINEIVKVLPGQCLTITPTEKSKTFYWNPQKISQTDVIEDVEEASRILRQTILSTVAAMAAPYDNVINQTGGLDSSILLASLAETPSALDVTCLNTYQNYSGGDERYFVRKAAAHVGVPLIEYEVPTVEFDFPEMAAAPITTSPPHYFGGIKFEKYLSKKLREVKGQAMFNGTGGDEILYIFGKNYAPIDYIKMHGIRWPLFRILMEASRMQKRSVWAILPDIIRGGFGKTVYDWSPAMPTSLLTSDIQDKVHREQNHPWIQVRDNVTPGKLDHITPLIWGHYNQECRVSPDEHFTTLYPLLSQPVIEACLRIPLWLMMAHGKNRGLARKAFKNYLPPEVIWRESKSLGGNYFDAIILDNMAAVKELMMDGEMVRNNVIDRRNLERTLNKSHDIEEGDFAGMIRYLNAEIWARKLKGENIATFARSSIASIA
ncbi:MAG: hypothetical protein JKY45_02640 [Emcibacter sp.]|nr:hypothetical protein [Emcibacter sp.]